jgi:hypothetical protein
MLIRRLSFLSFMLFVVYSTICVSATSPKRSTLPCLLGQPGFSEILIEKNPKALGKEGFFLGNAMVTIKLPPEPTSFSKSEWKEAMSGFALKFNGLQGTTEAIRQNLKSMAQAGCSIELALYIHRFVMCYSSMKSGKENWFDTYAIVAGHGEKPFNFHVSIGHFPIHFGAGFSEYPLKGGVLESDLGVTANLHAVSVQGGYHWGPKHETKIRLFGFIGEEKNTEEDSNRLFGLLGEGKDTEGDSKKKPNNRLRDNKDWGVHINHEWRPSFGSVSVGLSRASAFPMTVNATSKRPKESRAPVQDPLDFYCHIVSGPIKVKIEGVSLRRDTPQLFSNMMQFSKKDHMGNEKTAQKSMKQPLQGPYAGHVEIAYCLPLQKAPTAVLGYTVGDGNQLLTARRCVFFGLKGNILGSLNGIIGCRFFQNWSDNKKANKEPWRCSLNLQLSWTA